MGRREPHSGVVMAIKLKKIFGIIDRLKLVQGVERELLKRKRRSTISLLIALAASIQPMLSAIFDKDYLKILMEWDFDFSKFPLYQLLGIGVVVIGLSVALLLKRTSILLKESEEPFQYSFWIEPFKRVKVDPDEPFGITCSDSFHEKDNRFLKLLHHDLMERLNERIKRLSLLDVDSLKKSDPTIQEKLTSHIHIGGHYTIRQGKEEKLIHVMPRIRIGSAVKPFTLASSVKYRIDENENGCNIDTGRYNQIVERIVSSIATEIYRQIDIDIKEKLTMFPTAYTRAAALYHEAKDFARSNTVDAYDRAIYLYKEALRYFNISNIKWMTNLFIMCPLLWRLKVKYVHLQAKVQIGYAQSLIYRRQISALSGRYMNPLFGIPGALNSVIITLIKLHNKMNKWKWRLDINRVKSKLLQGNGDEKVIAIDKKNATMVSLTFPNDSWFRYQFDRPLQDLFARQKFLLFNAFTVAALTYDFLGAVKRAKANLEFARAIAPRLSEKNALFIFTAGAIEPDIDKEILLFSNAVEYVPDFEMAQYFLAYYSEMRFRRQNEIVEARASSVLKEYEAVIKNNPGNIAALAAQGYIHWLLGDEENLKQAKNKLIEGCDFKAIVRETFIGELNYGLARIAAEEGRFNESYDRFTQAISADPGVAAYSPPALAKTINPFFDYITPSILKRFEDFKKSFAREILLFNEGDFKDLNGLILKIKDKRRKLSLHLQALFSAEMKKMLRNYKSSPHPSNDIKRAFIDELNRVLQNKNFDYKQFDAKIDKKIVKNIRYCVTDWPYVYINRLALEKYYPDELYRHLNYSGEIDKRRTTCDKDDREVSRRTMNTLYSFILNDYGNACLNYFHRYGDNRQLDNAIEAFEEAVEKNPGNLVVYYNLQNAQAWGGYPVKEISKSLDEAEKLSYAWPAVLIASAEFRLQSGMEDLKKELDEINKKIESIKQEKTKAEKKSDLVDAKKEIIRETIQPLAKRLSELSAEEQSIREKYLKNILEKIETTINETKLSSLIKDFGQIIKGEEVNEILNEIKIDGLDEYDVVALRIWAEKLMYERNFDVAERISKTILEKFYPDNFDVNRQVLLEMYKRKNDHDKIKNCQEVIKSNIENWLEQDPIHYASLNWASDFFEIRQSTKILQDVIEKEGKNPGYHNMLGNLYYNNKDYEKSIEPYENAVAHEGDNPVYQNNLGDAYFWNEDYEKSIEPYERACKIDPKTAVYHANLIQAYTQSGKNREAKKAYKEAIAVAPSNPVYQNELGYKLYSNGDYKKAIKPYENAVALEENNPVYQNNLGTALYSNGNYEKSIEPYERACKIDPKMAVYHANLILAYTKSGRNQEAEKAYKEAIALDPSNPVYQNELGYEFYSNEDYEKAIEPYKNAVAHEGDNPVYQNDLGNAYFAKEDYIESIKYFRKACELNPKKAVYFAYLGLSYMRLKKWNEAKRAFLKALKIEPGNSEYHNELGTVYCRSGKYEKAANSYKLAVKFAPEVALYHANLGYSYLQLAKWNEAEEASLEALQIESDNPEYHNNLGTVYFRSGDYKKAANSVKLAVKFAPKSAASHAYLFRAYTKTGKKQEAEEVYKEAIAVDPLNPDYLNELGNAFRNNGDYEKANDLFEKARKLESKE
jgi:tetratricopeptide (TPR) repeat protein